MKIIKTAVEHGRADGYIAEEDSNIMVPDKPTTVQLYGLVMDHKPPVSGSSIPPLREVVSGSGSNTDFISAWMIRGTFRQTCTQRRTARTLPYFLAQTTHLTDLMDRLCLI